MNRTPHRRLQRGYGLLPLVAMAGTLMVSVIYVWASPRDQAALREQRTTAALAFARDTLIGRAAGDDTRPASLPCPDIDNDGTADGDFGNCTSLIGRLPWRTLGIAELRDGWGERLWYAMTSAYRDNASGGVLNSDTPGAYTVRDAAGTVLTTDAPAVIIAPGLALGAQSRESANQLVAAMYLEGENANGDTVFESRPADSGFNDRVLALTREDLFRPVVARVSKVARAALEAYRGTHGYYPAANPYGSGGPSYYCEPSTRRGRIPLTISGGSPVTGCASHAAWSGELPAWFTSNNWHLLTHYAVAGVCADTAPSAFGACTSGTGSDLSVASVSSRVRMLVIVSGPARTGQVRPCANPADCLEDAANADGDAAYIRPSAWPQSNDRMAATCAASSPCAVMP